MRVIKHGALLVLLSLFTSRRRSSMVPSMSGLQVSSDSATRSILATRASLESMRSV
jgi:hypothetical protein